MSEKPLNILFVTDAFHPETGGVERVCLEMAKSLTAAGHNVKVLTKEMADNPDTETHHGIRISRYPYSKAWTPYTYLTSIRSSAKLARRLHREKPFDVVHGHLTLSSVGPLKSLSTQALTACTFYGPWHEEYAIESKDLKEARPWPYAHYQSLLLAAQRRMQAGVVRKAKLRFTLSGYSIDKARTLAPELPEESFHILPGGVDPGKFSPGPDEPDYKRKLRRDLNLPESGFLVFTVRRLVKRMGVDNLIRAVGLLRDAGKDVHLVVGGSGPEKEALGRLTGELCLPDQVTFTGFVPEKVLPDFYRAADLFVLPTVAEENFGLIILEAAACGCPVIGTPVGSIPEVLGDLNPAFVCDSTEPGSIAEKIQWVRDQYDKMSWKFTKDLSARVRTEYAWNHLAENLVEQYRRELKQ